MVADSVPLPTVTAPGRDGGTTVLLPDVTDVLAVAGVAADAVDAVTVAMAMVQARTVPSAPKNRRGVNRCDMLLLCPPTGCGGIDTQPHEIPVDCPCFQMLRRGRAGVYWAAHEISGPT
jgi:hypothetical protein